MDVSGEKLILEVSGMTLTYYLDAIETINNKPAEEYKIEKNHSNPESDQANATGVVDAGQLHWTKGLEAAIEGQVSVSIEELTQALEKDSADQRFAEFSVILADFKDQIISQQLAGLMLRGLANRQRAFHMQAIEDFKKALELDGQYVPAHLDLAAAYLAVADKNNALAEYSRVVQLNPRSAQAYFGQGLIYLDRGECKKAITCFNKSARLNPADVAAYAALGAAYVEMGQYRYAKTYFQRVLRIDGSNPQSYFDSGKVYFYLGEYSEAKRKLDKAREMFKLAGNNAAAAKVQEYLNKINLPVD